MLRKLNLFLAMLSVIITIFPLTQARGRDGRRHGKDSKDEHHQIKRGKSKLHFQLTVEHQEAIKSKISRMKEAESTSEEIKQTVDQMMMNFGVNPAQRKDKGRGKGRNPFDQLTKSKKHK